MGLQQRRHRMTAYTLAALAYAALILAGVRWCKKEIGRC